MKGGMPIYPGGFSCVFKPSLRCASNNNNSNNSNSNKKITKLLLTEHAYDEMKILNSLHETLIKIPNIQKYILLDSAKMCTPDIISESELENFDTVCSNLHIPKSEINARLNEVKSINMPYSGITILEWVLEKPLTMRRFRILNKQLIQLLQRAIVPMNRAGVIHGDIKENNVLLNARAHPVLIDWGISAIFLKDAGTPTIPISFTDRSISISTPFSNIMFSDVFYDNYNQHLLLHGVPKTPKDPHLIEFCRVQFLDPNIRGHYDYIKPFFENGILIGAIDSTAVADELYVKLACEYMCDVLFHYTTPQTQTAFDAYSYFKDVYMYNVDVWGFMSIYISLYAYQFISLPFFKKIYHIYMSVLMVNGHKKINTSQLIHKLQYINRITARRRTPCAARSRKKI